MREAWTVAWAGNIVWQQAGNIVDSLDLAPKYARHEHAAKLLEMIIHAVREVTAGCSCECKQQVLCTGLPCPMHGRGWVATCKL